MTDERLMTNLTKQAAAAIELAWVERVKEDRPDTLSDRAARAAWAVFEEHAKELATSPEHVKNPADSSQVEAAHAPTDHERTGLIDAAAESFQHHEGAPTWQDDPVGRDAALRWHMRGYEDGLAASSRRSGSPEPSAEDEFAPGECDGSGTCSATSHIHGCYKPHRADQCDSPDEYGHIEPQGEPSEAAVTEAVHAIGLRGFHVTAAAMRAALRAAGEVGR